MSNENENAITGIAKATVEALEKGVPVETVAGIFLENAGPVESLTVPIERKGGVVIIKGMNNVGKSESLKAVARLLGSDVKIRKRYGTKRGVVEGLGMTLTLLGSATASGVCEAVSIEGKLSIGKLIDPGLKDPVAADKKRIESLLTLRGVKADLKLFAELVGGEVALLDVASDGTLAATDLVNMAMKLKQDLEAASRDAADKATTAEAEARAHRQLAEGVDMTGVSSVDLLQGLLESAFKREGRVIQAREDSDASIGKMAGAKKQLAEAKASYDGPTLEEADAEVEQAGNALDSANAEEAARWQAFKAAEIETSRVDSANAIAVERRTSAAQHQDAMIGWAETIESAADVAPVSDEEIGNAKAAVGKAREAVENGVRIRDAKKALALAEDVQATANALAKQADQLREAAKGTAGVLASAVGDGAMVPVIDDNGKFRFAVRPENEGDRRVYYHELGPGKRTTIAVIEAASCLRDSDATRLGLVVLPQEMWDGLDWKNRELVDTCAKELGITIVTGEADKSPDDTGGIRAVAFEPAIKDTD
jgi:hypothetical protein